MVFLHQIKSLTPAEAQDLVDDLRANDTIEITLVSLESLSPEVEALIRPHRTAEQQAKKDANDREVSEFTSGLASEFTSGLTDMLRRQMGLPPKS